jgi:hypothetical protein
MASYTWSRSITTQSIANVGRNARREKAVSPGAVLVLAACLGLAPSAGSAADPFPVKVQVDAAKSRGELKPIYRFFGADEPNYAYMKDGRKLLADLGKLGTPQAFFRTHNLLTTGDGTPRSSGAARTSTRRTRRASRSTTGRSSTASSTPTGARPQAVRADRLHAAGALGQAGAVPARVAPRPPVPGHLHGLGAPAEGLQEVGGARLPVGQALRLQVRQGRGRDVVLGGLERAEHRLLAGDARGVPEAPRLRDRRGASCASHGAGGRTRHSGRRW